MPYPIAFLSAAVKVYFIRSNAEPSSSLTFFSKKVNIYQYILVHVGCFMSYYLQLQINYLKVNRKVQIK